MSITLEADLGAQLCAAIGGLTEIMRQQAVADQQYRRRRNAAIGWIEAPAIPLGVLPTIRAQDGGPNTGFYWAVQRISVGPFGATSDLLTLYKGHSVADVVPQNGYISFTNQAAGTFVSYHVGGKGLILAPDESLIAAGTITGTNPVLNWDAIQIEAAFLYDYLA